MILQALSDYYHRRQTSPDETHRLPAFGLELKEISFILELDSSGALRAIVDTRHIAGKKKIGTAYLVPKGVKKTSGIAANLLWDNAEYILAVPDANKYEDAQAKGKADDYLSRLQDMKAAFRARVLELSPDAQRDEGIQAVLAFLAGDAQEQAGRFEAFDEIASDNPVLSFRLIGDTHLVCQRPAAMPFIGISGDADDSEADAGTCLITGDTVPTERLHTAIKGVWGAQTSGANIVSFNLDAFNSYAKTQGNNAPVGKAAAFAYTTALNALLARGSAQRLQVGDASTVFWSQKDGEPMEEWLAEIIGGDDPDAHTEKVKALFEAVRTGGFGGERGRHRFFVLGLAPNAARISVRFWHAAPLAEIAARVTAWFDDLRIARSPNDMEYPSLFRLLTAIAIQSKADNIPPRLGGDIVRSIFTGAPYPAIWLNAAIQRCRAEQHVSYLRAAAIKACLNRSDSAGVAGLDHHQREITEMLDPENPSAAYRLGRLFATLEKIQEEASPGLNATIRERYYGAASSTPVAVFTTLMRLKNHHLAKLTNKGRAVNFEKLLAEIMSGIEDFPRHMPLRDQGRFAIGYYHQRQDFFTRHGAAPNTTPPATTESEGAV
ncbi:MAG: type I-C CRISPR-associated protein Cas8c/Csd1 [Gammaproteobacteria bacterium]|nr:type I-C CRISPR-associated protein Cas8c/Csd1 [Gammaproteobacteria bacterium]MBU0771229.1 type I-C CRISPR-associated protein Cas8c/Csd1 [Gammaproteobacteria bacterium]MBU0856483.1 type I-C CRISPR-associated protein Cas8c/Csd1 [Gammaproteobacteria bacterium]MBU1847442.1 type I-C CRISPR-associated protein Cas8c/Csd1 [Gammaproteobacteria bacterium]